MLKNREKMKEKTTRKDQQSRVDTTIFLSTWVGKGRLGHRVVLGMEMENNLIAWDSSLWEG